MSRDIFQELFDNLEAVRDLLLAKYEWFTHDARFDVLTPIQNEGLQPRWTECPEELANYVRNVGQNITCFRPLGSDVQLEPHGTKDGPLVRLAVRGVDLPRRVGYDWSFTGDLPRIICNDSPNIDWTDVLLAVVRRRGLVAVYDPVPISQLRIWTQNLPDNPAEWPSVNDALLFFIFNRRSFSQAGRRGFDPRLPSGI